MNFFVVLRIGFVKKKKEKGGGGYIVCFGKKGRLALYKY